MQACLEVIADAVLQVVLYQVEADENESYLINPDASPLVQGVSLLIDLAKQKAKQWSETDEKHNEEIMLGYCQELYDSTLKISEFLGKLTNDAYDQDTKEELLFASKNCMVTTIKLMQIADYYDIRKVDKAGLLVKKDLAKLLQTNARSIAEDIRLFIYCTVTLAKEIHFRADYIPDKVLSEQLIAINHILSQEPENLIKLTAYLMQEPSDGLARDQRDSLEFKLLESVDSAIDITRESSRRMFEGLLLDLTPIERDKFISRNLAAPASIDTLITQMDEALEQLAYDSLRAKTEAQYTASMLNDMKKMNSFVISLRSSVNKQVEDEESPHRKEAILNALRYLEDSLKSVVMELKPALQDPNDNAISNLLIAIEKCRMACDNLQKITKGNEEYDLLNGAASNVRRALENLRNAIANGDKNQIITNTKDAVNGLRAEIENIADISPQIMTLVEGSKSLIATGNADKSLLNQLNFIIDECEDVASKRNGSPVFQMLDHLRKLDQLMVALYDNLVTPEFAEAQFERVLPSLATLLKEQENSEHHAAVEILTAQARNFFGSLNRNTNTAERAVIFQEQYPIFKQNLMKVADLSMEDTEEAILHNTTILHYQAQKMKEKLLTGDEDVLNDLRNQTRQRLERQILIAEMVEMKKDGEDELRHQMDNSIMELSLEYKNLAQKLETISTSSRESFFSTKQTCDDIMNLNKSILENNITPSRASMKITDLNIELEANVNEIHKISKTPRFSAAEIQPNLINIAESLQQQELLAQIVKKDLTRDGKLIDKSIANIAQSIQKVYTASADTMDTNDVASKNRLKKILDDTNIQSELLTAAVQKSLVDRIDHNSQKLYQQIPLLLHPSSLHDSDRQIEKTKFVKRFEKQLQLCKKVSYSCNNQLLKVPFIKLLVHGKKSLENYEATESPEIEDSIIMNLGTINQHLHRLANETVAENPNLEVNNLMDVANQIEQFSTTYLKDSQADDVTPKGRLSMVASSVASKMKVMSAGSALKNKKNFIESSKSIAQIVSDILAIAKELLQLFPTAKQQIKTEMLEMAHAAKNYSVQLKILAAVKTASAQDDPTTETQLLTCAKGLSNSIIQIINTLQVLELTAA